MRELTRDGGSRIVFIGSSIVATAVSPEVVTGHDSAAVAYNAGINRGVPTVLEHWVLERVVPLLRPTLAVVCMSSLELNDNSRFSQEVNESYYAAPIHRTRLARWILGLRLLYVALVARRRVLNRIGRRSTTPSLVDRLDALVPRRTFGAYRRWLDMTGTGQSRIYTDVKHRPSPTRDAKFVRDIVNDYAAGGTQTAALQRLIEALQSRCVDVTLVFLPHTAEYVGLHPHGMEDVEQARSATALVASERGIPFIDLQGVVLQSTHMADCIHPNGAGSRRLSEALNQRLQLVPAFAVALR